MSKHKQPAKPPLAFYDQHRMGYVHLRETDPDEFMIGGYSSDDFENDGVDERGEFKVVLHRFNETSLFGTSRPSKTISAQLCIFNDAFAALAEITQKGVLSALETTTLHTRDDLTRLLLACGLVDVSREPVSNAQEDTTPTITGRIR